MAMLIRNAELNGQIVDVLIEHGRIVNIGKNLSCETVFEAKGGAILPALHDHHIHLNALAAAINSLRCGPPEITTKAQFIKALNVAGDGWLRGVGYHHSVAGMIDRDWLDSYGPKRPVRIQHRSGRLWILNSLAMDALGLPESVNGRLLDRDTMLRTQLNFPDLKPLINKLLSYGVTGVTEVTPSNGVAEYEHYMQKVEPLRLNVMGKAELSAQQSQYLKLHYHDHDLPSLDLLADEIEQAYHAGRNIAAHCVTRAELMLTLAAIEMAGAKPGGRIEHAAIADEAAIEWMKKLDLIVVTQPNFIKERHAAYLQDVPKNEHKNLWRLKSFIDAGLKVAAGSDAPFGNSNPWAAMAAATSRPKGFECEAVTPDAALALYTKPAHDAGAAPRRIDIGELADMCVLDRTWQAARVSLADVNVIATWTAGELAYEA